MASRANREADISAFEIGLIGEEPFTFPGKCAVCGREAAFLVDYQCFRTGADGRRIPNWRETLVCPHCHLNNRMRAAVGFLLSVSKLDDAVYLTEFVTPLFQVVASKRKRTIGSEYLSDGTASGTINSAGVRHEDATRLSFSDGAFNVIGTFDVLEHVPDYQQALAEFFRCLRPGGTLIITVPFSPWSAATVTRAIVDTSGTIKHLMPPEIHGDPLDPDGALCFYHFGWDFVGALTEAGFEDAGISMFWNPQFGYLGGYQSIITAHKATVPGRFHGVLSQMRRVFARLKPVWLGALAMGLTFPCSPTVNDSPLRAPPTIAAGSYENKASARRATDAFGSWPLRLPGPGCGINLKAS